MTAEEALGAILQDPTFRFDDDGLARIAVGDELEIVLQQGDDAFGCSAWLAIADAQSATPAFWRDAMRLNHVHQCEADPILSLDSQTNLIVGKIVLHMSTLSVAQAEAAFNRLIETGGVMQALIASPPAAGGADNGPFIDDAPHIGQLA